MLTLKRDGAVLIDGRQVGRWLKLRSYIFQADDGLEVTAFRLSVFRRKILASMRDNDGAGA